jgi:hypothetical protein
LVTSGIDVARDVHAANTALDEMLQLLALRPTTPDAAGGQQILRTRQVLGQVARTFQVDQAVMEHRLHEIRQRMRQPPPKKAEPSTVIDPWDFELLALISYHPDLLPFVREAIPGHYLTSAAGRTLYDLWLQLDDGPNLVTFGDVLLAADDPESKRALVEIDEYARKYEHATDDGPSVLRELIASYQRRAGERDARAAMAEVDCATSSEQDQIAALTRMVDQQRKLVDQQDDQGVSVPRDG